MDLEEQVNKSNQDVYVWRMNGDDGENNGESLILLLLFLGGTYLPFTWYFRGEWDALYFIFLFSQVGILYP